MRTVNHCLCFDGDAEQAFAFYRSVFGEQFEAVIRCGGR